VSDRPGPFADYTLTEARAECRALGYTLRRTEAREYRVCRSGAPESSAYYASDLPDALETAHAMRERERAAAGRRA
jgi:hypothetical protein